MVKQWCESFFNLCIEVLNFHVPHIYPFASEHVYKLLWTNRTDLKPWIVQDNCQSTEEVERLATVSDPELTLGAPRPAPKKDAARTRVVSFLISNLQRRDEV